MMKTREDNPVFHFVTLDSRSKNAILVNLTRHLGSNLSDIARHIDYNFILTGELHPENTRSELLQVLFKTNCL